MTWNCDFICLWFIIIFISESTDALKCKCEHNDDCPNFNSNMLTCEIPDGASFCYSSLNYTYDSHDKIFRENRQKGCGYLSDYTRKCSKSLQDLNRPTDTLCCRVENCNVNLTPHIDEIDDLNYFNTSFLKNIRSIPDALVVVVTVLGIVGLTVTFVVLYLCRCQRKCRKSNLFDVETGRFGTSPYSVDGSGRGGAIIVQRTFGKKLFYQESIGEGTYGTVHKGLLKGLPVAIKVTGSVNEQSFFNETSIYSSSFLHHDNILRFISGDTVQLNCCTYYIMVFEYHQNGSLYEFLKINSIDLETVCKMILSLSFGLEQLHEEFLTANGNKYGVAHRDLKSRNILVKDNLECCIADFGLSVMNCDESNNPRGRKEIKLQVGTKRYMAPELLDQKIDPYNFSELLRTDIYSYALILWEIVNNYVEGIFRLPYFDSVSSDPSIEEMKQVVCKRELRPQMDSRDLERDPFLDALYRAMSEFWSANPDIRNTALYARKRIQRILKKAMIA